VAGAHGRGARFASRYEQGVHVVLAPDLLWGPLRSGWDPYSSLARALLLRAARCQIVHAFECRPTVLLPALAAAAAGATLITDWCDWLGRGGSVEERPSAAVRTVLRPVETFFEERFRARAAGTTVICSTLRRKAEALGVPPAAILDLRDGADIEGIRPADRLAARRALGLPADAVLVGYVGQIFARDAQLMAAAFDLLQAQLSTARLLLIGHVNMPVERWSEVPAAMLRSGPIAYSELGRYLAACDCCWLPLRDSGANRGRWPLKLNDYMAAGRATVATAVGDVADVLRAHPVGLLAGDAPAELAATTLELLGDHGRRAAMGRSARQVAETHFDWRLRAAELEAFYLARIAAPARSEELAV
jgi:glycosyltransferase involved in cell wall biosynthesis